MEVKMIVDKMKQLIVDYSKLDYQQKKQRFEMIKDDFKILYKESEVRMQEEEELMYLHFQLYKIIDCLDDIKVDEFDFLKYLYILIEEFDD